MALKTTIVAIVAVATVLATSILTKTINTIILQHIPEYESV